MEGGEEEPDDVQALGLNPSMVVQKEADVHPDLLEDCWKCQEWQDWWWQRWHRSLYHPIMHQWSRRGENYFMEKFMGGSSKGELGGYGSGLGMTGWVGMYNGSASPLSFNKGRDFSPLIEGVDRLDMSRVIFQNQSLLPLLPLL